MPMLLAWRRLDGLATGVRCRSAERWSVGSQSWKSLKNLDTEFDR